MKLLKMLGIALLVSVSAAHAEVCSDPLRNQDMCLEMRHLRSQVLELGAQRDLMQVNYPYMAKIASEINGITGRVIEKMKIEDPTHASGLAGIQALSAQMVNLATNSNADSFVIANRVQTQCATCHAKDSTTGGRGWGSIFKNDWSAFYKTCNEYDRNPYRCKSMHGMLSAYSSLFTASQLGRQDYELTKMNASEIARIAGDLKAKQMFHGSEVLIAQVEKDALEVVALAEKNNSAAFEKSVGLTQACMQCHADRSFASASKLVLKVF